MTKEEFFGCMMYPKCISTLPLAAGKVIAAEEAKKDLAALKGSRGSEALSGGYKTSVIDGEEMEGNMVRRAVRKQDQVSSPPATERSWLALPEDQDSSPVSPEQITRAEKELLKEMRKQK